jgi:hypothetical protein
MNGHQVAEATFAFVDPSAFSALTDWRILLRSL